MTLDTHRHHDPNMLSSCPATVASQSSEANRIFAQKVMNQNGPLFGRHFLPIANLLSFLCCSNKCLFLDIFVLDFRGPERQRLTTLEWQTVRLGSIVSRPKDNIHLPAEEEHDDAARL